MSDDLVYTIPKSNAFVCVAPSVIVGNVGESAGVVLISRSVSGTLVIPAGERNEPELAAPGRPALAFCAIALLLPRLLTVTLGLFKVIVRRLFLADSDCNAVSLEERIRFFTTVRVELSDVLSSLRSSVDELS